jgi:hypothetical protein
LLGGEAGQLAAKDVLHHFGIVALRAQYVGLSRSGMGWGGAGQRITLRRVGAPCDMAHCPARRW